jgi:exopolysaccharide production protein ExoQ
MKGLTGSANAIGIIAAFALTAAILYFREFNRFGRHVAFALVPSALACLYLSNNRGSMIAVAAALWFSYVFRGGTNFKIVLSATGAVVATALLVSFPDEIFAMLSRSGRVDEITSATGRSAIWAVVIELWAQRPILGYGYTSALLLLPSDPRLFNVAAHAHNMFLELLFAGGILLFAAFSYAAIRTFVEIYRLRAINEGALLVFFLARGLTEAGPFGGMTGYTSIAFAVTLALVISKSIEARSRTAVNARPASSRLQALRA